MTRKSIKSGVKRKRYTIKPTHSQIEEMKRWWKVKNTAESIFLESIGLIEANMRKNTGIKDIEFFWNDHGEICGVGNESKTMRLIHDTELER